MSVPSYPLQWPAYKPRRAPNQRKHGQFSKRVNNGRWDEKKALTVADALDRLQSELDLLGAGYPVISSNLETRLDGRPKSGKAEPADSGVALYFDLGGEPHCMPCDTYIKVADNIAALAAHIKALRAIERYGVTTVKESFAGFVALPAPSSKRPWREVLKMKDFDAAMTDADMIEQRYRALAKKAHPDAPGGSHDAMAELNRAKDESLREIGHE